MITSGKMKNTEKKTIISSEVVYVATTMATSLATAMLSAADFGISMVVAPSYIISLRVSGLTFGQTGYIIQGILLIVLFVILRKIKLLYLFSFVSGFLFGTALDLWRAMIPQLNPELYAPGEYLPGVRVLLFIAGFLLNAFGVTLYFKTYFYPQGYEFFVKKICIKYKFAIPKFKLFFDLSCLLISILTSMILFHRLEGIGTGTVIIAFLNGFMIGIYEKIAGRFVIIRPYFRRFAEKFD